MSRNSRTSYIKIIAILGALTLAGVILAVSVRTTEHTPAAASASTGTVVAVVDGDTIDVDLDEGKQRIRVIGIDTPEIAREAGKTSDCYAEEARTFLDELLYGRTVELRSDPSQDNIDKYGRLLRHVYIDGQNAAHEALSAGMGREYTYSAPYEGQADYQAAEEAARGGQLGLWGVCSA